MPSNIAVTPIESTPPQTQILIHSADPQSRPDNLSVRTSVPTFQNLAKQNKFQPKTKFTTGETVGLAEWIIDDTNLSFFLHVSL